MDVISCLQVLGLWLELWCNPAEQTPAWNGVSSIFLFLFLFLLGYIPRVLCLGPFFSDPRHQYRDFFSFLPFPISLLRHGVLMVSDLSALRDVNDWDYVTYEIAFSFLITSLSGQLALSYYSGNLFITLCFISAVVIDIYILFFFFFGLHFVATNLSFVSLSREEFVLFPFFCVSTWRGLYRKECLFSVIF